MQNKVEPAPSLFTPLTSCLLLLIGACLGIATGWNFAIQPTLSLDEFCTYLDSYLAEEECLLENSTVSAAFTAFTPGVHTRTEIHTAIGQFRYQVRVNEHSRVVSVADYYDLDQAPIAKLNGPNSSLKFSFNAAGILVGINPQD